MYFKYFSHLEELIWHFIRVVIFLGCYIILSLTFNPCTSVSFPLTRDLMNTHPRKERRKNTNDLKEVLECWALNNNMLNYLIMSKPCKLRSIIIPQMNQTPLQFIVWGQPWVVEAWSSLFEISQQIREERISHEEVASDKKNKEVKIFM